MTRYACTNPGCPRRDPVTAASAPTCYTCAQPMAPPRTFDPTRAQITFGGIRINGVPGRRRGWPPGAPAASTRGLCDQLLTVEGVTMACLVEHDRGEIEVFVDGGHPDAIARCIYGNTWPGVMLRGLETGDVGTGTRVAFSRGAAAAAVASVPPRVLGCILVGVGGATTW